ncbi:hypothetical protein FYJ78_04930 [Selenomonas sp. WCA-380-WT-3B 3/]|uniref:GH26 domain-containing protein n=1 Tax=Selenomonas montiformis TaxID=2652285 RepID=A0A6I2UWQ9_9FIRM|nr:glycosyl hydrolase [Selenomonas montiformis]MSV24540.1 hypothetical protein [Selenomonas montiformis]
MNKKLLQRVIPMTLSLSLLLPAAGVIEAGAAQPAVRQTWEFAQGAQDWGYVGKWAYKGKPAVQYDKSVGKGAIRVDVDFSPTADKDWSEVKLGDAAVTKEKPMALKGYNRLSYDLYYQPAQLSKGTLKTKVYMKDEGGHEVQSFLEIERAGAVDAGDGLKKVHVSVPFDPADIQASLLNLSLVGSSTDYKGPLYVDNICLDFDDGYVVRTVWPVKQEKVKEKALKIPSVVQLTDPAAIDNAAKLYAYMKAMADTDYVLYGHMNDLLMHAGPGDSDTYGLVRDYPAVMPIDAMTLAGSNTEYQNHEPAPGALPAVTGKAAIQRAVELSVRVHRKGAIVSLSAHMPNFAQVAEKGKTADGYDYSGFTSVVTAGDVVRRVMPGGDLNEVFTGYLDKIADYGLALQKQGIPVLFRPYHENNGSWFWWGAAHCSASEFKNLFRYTEEYLRDVRGVHNFLYVYSPNGPFVDEDDYMTRYPGDAFVDIPGFDMYQEKPQKKDGWMDSFSQNMDIVQSFAEHHNKLTTVPEAGILCGKDTLGRTGAQRKDWFLEALDVLSRHKMSYFSTWSNFNADVFDQPYMVDKKRGHEMADGFTRFYNDPRSVFAGQMIDYTKWKVSGAPVQKAYAYILTPSSNSRVCEPAEIRAKAAGTYKEIRFALRGAKGELVAELPAQNVSPGIYQAAITKDLLNRIGQTVGTVEVLQDGRPADRLKVFFNMPFVKAPAEEVDTFESYYGDNEMLKGAYSTNCGPGCSIMPALTVKPDERQGEGHGLDFHYKLVKGGWAGVIKSMGADWSSYDAVQFWLKPDGRGQRFLIQINTDGEDFEVNLTDLAGTTAPQLVTIPFSRFQGKNGGQFNPAHIQHVAFYCNTIGEDPVDSHFYIDNVKAVNSAR